MGAAVLSLSSSQIRPDCFSPRARQDRELSLRAAIQKITFSNLVSIHIRAFEPGIEFRTLHCGANLGHFETSIIHFPTSEGVSEVSERANERAQQRARAKQAVRSKRTRERCEWTSGRTSEWPCTYVLILAVLPHCAIFIPSPQNGLIFAFCGVARWVTISLSIAFSMNI